MAQQQQFGMFGPLPEEVIAAQQRQGMSDDIAIAQMNPENALRFGSAQGGRALGEGIRGILGGEDPAVARAKKLQQISKDVQASGINPGDFEGFYGKLGEKLMEAGMVREAASVADALQGFKDKKYDSETKRFAMENAKLKWMAARDGKMENEIVKAIFSDNSKYDSKTLQAYLDSITPANPAGTIGLLRTADPEQKNQWSVVGTNDQNIPVWENKDGRLAISDEKGNLQPYGGPVSKMAKGGGSTSISVGLPTMTFTNTVEAQKPGMSPADEGTMSALSEPRAKAFAAAGESIAGIEPTVAAAERAVSSGNFAWGTGAETQVNLLRARATAASLLGIQVDNEKLNNTDTLKQYTSKSILPLLAQIGGNDSNEEMAQMMKVVGDTFMTPDQFKRAIAITKKEITRFKTRQDAFSKGLAEKRTDVSSFFANNYKWPTGDRIRYQSEPGKNTTKTEYKGTPPEVAPYQNQPQPQAPQQPQPAPQAPVMGFAPNVIQKYMAKWPGLSAEQVAERLNQVKANQGQ